jgi:hypothetical protein
MILAAARHAAPATCTPRDKQTRFSKQNKDKGKNQNVSDSNSNLTKSMTHHNQTNELTTWFLTDIAGASGIRSRNHEGGSVRRDATWILSAAPGAISPCMWSSFVDRRYSPSTGMGLSQWEVILDELICMGYIVKEELDSDHKE